MIPIETIAIFSMASVALALAPGPDNIFVLTQSALHGRKAGFLVTIGLCTGLLVHTATVSLGVAAIFQTSTIAFNILKIVGAVYLLFLAWQAFRAGAAKLNETGKSSMGWRKLYSRGVIMNITNPKVAIFFLAFLPQFADPSRGSITIQLLMFGGLFIITTLLIFSAIAWSAGYLGEWLKGSMKAQIIMNRIAGMVFTGLALRLAISER
ncbi:MAG: LysE family translocator [Methylococcales symbiont of Iophon sp. n. MRB-2018]|nr:MAG: LysE family translocator [Methylococcales symbiont of Iophon sp. n. MRB-2018]KAF3980563.1 MAG: LysE family translocator [Methylococcales symbiont of Iophon sp. n. MRB-2018]